MPSNLRIVNVQFFTDLDIVDVRIIKKGKPIFHRQGSNKIIVETAPKGSPPEFVVKLQSQKVDEGKFADFSCKVIGEPKPEISWYYNGKDITNQLQDFAFAERGDVHILDFKKVDPQHAGEFVVSAKNPFGEVHCAAQLEVTAKPKLVPPRFVVTLDTVEANEGDDITFKCKANGVPVPKILWYKNGEEIRENYHNKELEKNRFVMQYTEGEWDADSLLFVIDVIPECEGTYTAQAFNGVEPPAITEGLLTVKPKVIPPEFTVPFHDISIMEKTNLTLKGSVTGKPEPEVKWFKDNTELKKTFKQTMTKKDEEVTLSISGVTTKMSGIYKCYAENKAGKAVCEAKVEIKEHMEVPKLTKKPANKTVNETVTAKFEAAAKGKPVPDIIWYKGEEEIKPTDRVKIISSEDRGEVKSTLIYEKCVLDDTCDIDVVARNPAGDDSATAKLTVKVKPEKPVFLTPPTDLEIMENEDAIFMANISGKPQPEVEWSKGIKTLKSSERLLVEQEGDIYRVIIKEAQVNESGTYSVKAKNSAGSVSANATLKVNRKIILEPPEFIETYQNMEVTERDNIVLAARVVGIPEPKVQWFRDGKEVTKTFKIKVSQEGNLHKLSISGVTMSQAGVYKAVATNDAGTAEHAATVTVTEKLEAPVFTKPLQNKEIREGQKVKLDCTYTGIPQPKLIWYKIEPSGTIYQIPVEGRAKTDTREIRGEYTTSLTLDDCGVEDEGQVKVTATNEVGEATCQCNMVVAIKKEMPKFLRKPENQECLEFEDVTFETKVGGKPEPTVAWFLSDKEQLESANVIHEKIDNIHRVTLKNVKKEQAGMYAVKATNDQGTMSASARLKVTPVKPPSIVKPHKDLVAPEQGPAQFVSKITGYPTPEVKWYLNNEELVATDTCTMEHTQKDHTYTLTLKDDIKGKSGKVTVHAQNIGGEAKADANLTVRGRAPVFIEKPLKCVILEGQSTVFRTRIDGDPYPKIEWSKGKWSKIQPSNAKRMYYDEDTKQHVLEMDDTKAKDAGTYTVTISNEYGSQSCPATLMITENPEEVEHWKVDLKTTIVEVKDVDQEHYDFTGMLKFRITKDIEDQHIKETEYAVFEGTVSHKKIPVQWFLNGKEIIPNPKFQIFAEDYVHRLAINLAETKDSGEVKLKFRKSESKAKLTVDPIPPSFVNLLDDVAVTEGDTATFECAVNPPWARTKWYMGGVQILPSSKYVMTSDGGIRRLQVKQTTLADDDGVGAVVGDEKCSAHLTVNPIPPTFLSSIGDVTLYEKDTARFTCQVDPADSKVTWYLKGRKITENSRFKQVEEDNIRELFVYEAEVSDSGRVKVTTGDEKCEAILTVEEMPPAFLEHLEDVTVMEKETAKFSCVVEPSDTKIRWYMNDKRVRDSARIRLVEEGAFRELFVYDADLKDAGKISAVVGEERSDAMLIVEEIPPAFVHELQDVVVTERDTAKFSCRVDPADASIEWFMQDKALEESNKTKLYSRGALRELYIHQCKIEDAGRVSALVGDQQSNANLFVEAIPPSFISPLKDLTVTEGDEANFSCTVDPPDTPIAWYLNSKELRNSNKASMLGTDAVRELVIRDCELKEAGKVMAVVGNVRSEANLIVEEIPPSFLKPIEDLVVIERETAKFSCMVDPVDTPVTWYMKGRQLTDSYRINMKAKDAQRELHIRNAALDDAGDVSVVVGNERCDAQLIVEAIQPSFVRRLRDVVVTEKEAATFTCTVDPADTNIKWYMKDEEIISDSDIRLSANQAERSMTIKETELEDAGPISAKVGDETSTAKLYVEAIPPTFFDEIRDVTLMERETAKFTCTVDPPEAEIKWFLKGKQLSNNDRVKLVENYADRQLVIKDCKIDDGGKVTASVGTEKCDAILIVKERPPTFTHVINDVSVMERDPALFSCNVDPSDANVRWYLNDKLIRANDKFKMTVDGAARHLYINYTSLEDNGVVSATVGDERADGSLVVEELPPTILEPIEDDVVTEGDAAKFTCKVDPPTSDAKWFLSGKEVVENNRFKILSKGSVRELLIHDSEVDDSGQVSVLVGDERCNAKLIVEEIPPIFHEKPTDCTVTERDTAKFSCTVSPDDSEVKWYLKDNRLRDGVKYTLITRGPTRELFIQNAELSDAGKVSVVVGEERCDVRLTVEEIQPTFLKPLRDVQVTERDTAQFTCSVDPPDSATRWYLGDRELFSSGRFKMTKSGGNRVLDIGNCELMDAGVVTVTTGNEKSQADLIVDAIPASFISKINDVTVTEGDSAKFTCKVDPSDTGISWFVHGKQVEQNEKFHCMAIGNTRELVVLDCTLEDGGNVSAVLVDTKCEARLTVEAIPEVMTEKPTDTTVTERENARFSCKVYPDDSPVTWVHKTRKVRDGTKYKLTKRGGVRDMCILDCDLEDQGPVKVTVGEEECEVQLVVNEIIPTFESPLKDLTVTERDTAKFSCRVDPPTATVEWLLNNKPLPKDDRFRVSSVGGKRELVINNTKLTDAGVVAVLLDSDVSEARLGVKEIPPSFLSKLRDQSVTERDTAEFTCKVDPPTSEVSWFLKADVLEDGGRYEMISDGPERRLVITNCTMDDAGQVSATAGNESCHASLIVEGIPPSILEPLADVTVMERDTAKFTCKVDPLNADISWQLNKKRINQGDKYSMSAVGPIRTLEIYNTELDDAGQMTAKVGNDQSSATLIVNGIATFTACQKSDMVELTAKTRDDSCMVHVEGGIVEPLEDLEITKDDTAVFHCTVDPADAEVTWLFEEMEIDTSTDADKYVIVEDGKIRELHIYDCTTEESGNCTVSCGRSISGATLTVVPTKTSFERLWQKYEEEPGWGQTCVEFDCKRSGDLISLTDNVTLSQTFEQVKDARKRRWVVRKIYMNNVDHWVVRSDTGLSGDAMACTQLKQGITDSMKYGEQMVTFTVQLQSPSKKVRWLKGVDRNNEDDMAEILHQGGKYKMRSEENNTYILEIKHVKASDYGIYIFKVIETTVNKQKAQRLTRRHSLPRIKDTMYFTLPTRID